MGGRAIVDNDARGHWGALIDNVAFGLHMNSKTFNMRGSPGAHHVRHGRLPAGAEGDIVHNDAIRVSRSTMLPSVSEQSPRPPL